MIRTIAEIYGYFGALAPLVVIAAACWRLARR